MFFHSWAEVGRVVAVAVILFVLAIALLRIVGQHALAKMSGYDVVFTISMGSLLATGVLGSPRVAVVDVLAALATLAALQEVTRWAQSRWLPAHHVVREAPIVVLWDGKLLDEVMTDHNLSGDEIRAVVRRAGWSSMGEMQLIALENDGEWSIVPRRDRHTDFSAFYGLNLPGVHWDSRGRAEEIPDTAKRLP
jgi:uncharacterized membrane protein YcaP (DUF421 family)